MALVEYANGTTRPVKNLGWLIRHASAVRDLNLLPDDTGKGYGFLLIAFLTNGMSYSTHYASHAVFKEWIGRSRTLRHVPVYDYRHVKITSN